MGKMDVQSIAKRTSNLTNYILLLLLINCNMCLNKMGTLLTFEPMAIWTWVQHAGTWS